MYEKFLSYLLYIRGLSTNTIIRYRKGFKKFESFLKKTWKTLDRPNEIMLADIYEYITKLGENGIAPSSINVDINWIKGYFKYLRNVLNMDVLDISHIPNLRIPERNLGYYNEEQKKQIIDAVRDWIGKKKITKLRNRLLTYMFLYTGLRCHEVCKIKVDEIWESLQVVGKWGKRRFVYLRPELLDLIHLYLGKRKRKSAWLFDTNKWHLTTDYIRKIYMKLSRKLGFHIHAHKFRHTFCTDLLHIPWANIYAVSKLMGHSQITTTQIYLGVDDSELQRLQFWLNFV